MADPKGFLKITERELPSHRPVPVRIQDWREVYEDFDRAALIRQASRCMDCGIPFCHNGCPLGNLIPEWNDLVYRHDWRDAIERLHATNNFPEFTGRLCPAPCESACVLGINQPAVTIKNVEVSIIDRAWEEGWVRPQPPAQHTGKKVAVVGSGPAGLAAAQQLTRAGHTVTVYERADRIGGLLRYGIPEFKLEKRHLERRLAQMRAEGTEFRTGVNVGVDLTADQLRADHDAVILAGGATVWRDLPIPGRHLAGVHQAMEYLPLANRVQEGDFATPPITAEGKHVVVIGGGLSGASKYIVPAMVRTMGKNRLTLSGNSVPSLQMQVSDLTSPEGMQAFLEDHSTLVRVPGTGREVRYRSEKKTGVAVSRIGTGRAVALGAYAYALSEIDRNNL